jgi:hypothetical protein
MKKITLLLLLFVSSKNFAQKVDLDRFYFDVKYQDLPTENVPLEKRTYGVHVKTGGPVTNYMSESAMYDKINLAGWKRVETDPTVGIDLVLEDFVYRGSEAKTETVSNKDKDGKVTSTTYYWVEARYSTRGYAKISGPMAPPKQEVKKEEAKPVNKFLANAVINKPAAPTEDAQSISFNKEITYTTDKNTSGSSTATTQFVIA